MISNMNHSVNTLRMGDVRARYWARSSLVQVNDLSPMQRQAITGPVIPNCQLELWEQILAEFEPKYKNLHPIK